MANVALGASERTSKSVAVYDMRYAKPLDINLLDDVGRRFKHIITIEDGIIRGGVGEAIIAHLARRGYTPKVVTLGIDDCFVEHGKPAELYAESAYNEEALVRAIDAISLDA